VDAWMSEIKKLNTLSWVSDIVESSITAMAMKKCPADIPLWKRALIMLKPCGSKDEELKQKCELYYPVVERRQTDWQICNE
jgi:hypothetical protein